MKRRLITMIAAIVTVLLIPSAAWAHACGNFSRADGDVNFEEKGRWVWLADFDVWGFAPPGTLGPDDHGNFQNGDAHALLENSAACDGPGADARTAGTGGTHGVQNFECLAP